VCTASIIRSLLITSETPFYFNEITQGYIPEIYHLHTNHLENLKYRISVITEPQITNCLRKCTRALDIPLDMKLAGQPL
jgi:hypothetical protein